MHADDNLIESRLRQLEGRTGSTGPLSARTGSTGNLSAPEPTDPFWPTMITEVPSPSRTNRWLGPILGIVVGSVLTHTIATVGANDRHPVVTIQAGSVDRPGVGTPDPTTAALSRLIAVQPTAQTPVAPTRSIDRDEVLKLGKAKGSSVGRRDPFAVLGNTDPVVTPIQPPTQVLVPDPPATRVITPAPQVAQAPASTPAPRPSTQIRFNGSMSSDGIYTALVEEISQGQSAMKRWRLGDTVVGGYQVVQIGLRSLTLRWGSETITLAAGGSRDLLRRDGQSSGLSALAPEPADIQPAARPAVWRSTPAPVRQTAAPVLTPIEPPAPPPVVETLPAEEAPAATPDEAAPNPAPGDGAAL